MSWSTPLPRSTGPLVPKSIAICGDMIPMPAVRLTKIALVVSSAWYSAA